MITHPWVTTICLIVTFTASNFLWQVMADADWWRAAERSWFQAVAMLWLAFVLTRGGSGQA